jgi:outer membrane protein insertion porin family
MTQLQNHSIYSYLIIIISMISMDSMHGLTAQTMLQTVEFSGNNHFSSGQLLKRSGLRGGMLYNEQLIRAASRNMILAYKQDGFLYARIDSVNLEKIGDREINLKWYISEDKSFRLGQFDIHNELFSRETILNQLDLQAGDIYREELIEAELKQLGLFFARHGYPLAVIKPGQVQIQLLRDAGYYTVNLPLTVAAGRRIRIDEFSITGNHITKDKVILRELGIHQGDLYDQHKIEQIPQNLNRLGFFKNVRFPTVLIKDSLTTLLQIDIEEGNTTTFDGIVGYIPAPVNQPEQQGYFTGLIQLGFRNLFGTGRRFDVYWKKSDQFSDEFRLFYEEPWIFNLPVNLGGALERVVRDTTYIERSYSLSSTIRFSSNFHVKLQLISKGIIPDSSASRILRLTNNTVFTGDLGLEYDSRDLPYNPRRGLLYQAFYSEGLKKNNGPAYLLQEDSLAGKERLQSFRLDLAYFINLGGNQVLAAAFAGKRISSNKNQLQLSDHFWFGGTTTLRGYRENQFHGETIAWCNLEYRFLTGRDSRIFVFNDWGYYYYQDTTGKHEDVLPAYGLGLRFRTPLGILGVDYGLGKGDTFSTGKIHFSVINTF